MNGAPSPSAVTEARLAGPTDIAGFRREARQLLSHQVPPEAVLWSAAEQVNGAAAPMPAQDGEPRSSARASSAIVPASFVRLCDYVVQHRDEERFALLYRLLWRLVHEPALRHDAGDPDMVRAQHMAHAVRRDIHKCKANLRFRAVPDPASANSPVHMAWSDPSHHIVESVAPWVARRHGQVRWVLLTPARSAYWDGECLHYGPGGSPTLTLAMDDAQWLARWRALFAFASVD